MKSLHQKETIFVNSILLPLKRLLTAAFVIIAIDLMFPTLVYLHISCKTVHATSSPLALNFIRTLCIVVNHFCYAGERLLNA